MPLLKHFVKNLPIFFPVQNKYDAFERLPLAMKAFYGLIQQDLGTASYGESPNPGSDGWEGYVLHPSFCRSEETIPYSLPERFFACSMALPHASGVDDVMGKEIPSSRDNSLTEWDRTYPITLLLDGWPPPSSNGAGYAASKEKACVGGVHDGVNPHFANIALSDFNLCLHACRAL